MNSENAQPETPAPATAATAAPAEPAAPVIEPAGGSPFDLAGELISERPSVSPKADSIAAQVLNANMPPIAPGEKPKRGRPAGSKTKTTKTPTSTLAGVPGEPDAYEKAAAGMVASVVGMCRAFIDGDEWEASPAEYQEMVRTTAATFRQYDIKDFPPVVGMVFAFGAYAVPRFARPKTKAKGLSWAERLRAWRDGRKPKNKDGEK